VHGLFGENPERSRLLERFEAFLERLAETTSVPVSIYLDGSFVTDWESCCDIDVIIEARDFQGGNINEIRLLSDPQVRKEFIEDFRVVLHIVVPGLQPRLPQLVSKREDGGSVALRHGTIPPQKGNCPPCAMNSSSSKQTWQHLVDGKARDLHEQIAAAYLWTKQNAGEDEELSRNLTRQQYDWLRNLTNTSCLWPSSWMKQISRSKSAGRLLESLIRGLSIVSSMFTDVRKHVAQVTKAVAGVRDPLHDEKPFHMPTEMELGFSSLVHNGTVRFGFTLPRPEETLLQADDPLFQAVTRAVKAIRSVSFSLSKFDSEAEVGQGKGQRRAYGSKAPRSSRADCGAPVGILRVVVPGLKALLLQVAAFSSQR
jgi:hypothetical protein